MIYKTKWMRESFSEYKKTLETNLMCIQYLYDGDVNFSTDSVYNETKKSPLTSPSVMINCITKIYEESFNNLKSRSRELVIPEETLKYPSGKWQALDTNKILSAISNELGSSPHYIFSSEKSYRSCGFDNRFQLETTKPFPGYFYSLTKLTGLHTDVFYSPFVEDSDDELVLYAVDKSFQSLVYSIQNMEYKIEMSNSEDFKNNKPYHEMEWIHTIEYKLYDCKFNAIKIIIKNISKLRDDKINEILNGN